MSFEIKTASPERPKSNAEGDTQKTDLANIQGDNLQIVDNRTSAAEQTQQAIDSGISEAHSLIEESGTALYQEGQGFLSNGVSRILNEAHSPADQQAQTSQDSGKGMGDLGVEAKSSIEKTQHNAKTDAAFADDFTQSAVAEAERMKQTGQEVQSTAEQGKAKINEQKDRANAATKLDSPGR